MLDKDKILQQFGGNLKKARLLKGVSQEKMALDIGFDRTYISLLERGVRCPSLYTTYRIGVYLDLKTKDLINF